MNRGISPPIEERGRGRWIVINSDGMSSFYRIPLFILSYTSHLSFYRTFFSNESNVIFALSCWCFLLILLILLFFSPSDFHHRCFLEVEGWGERRLLILSMSSSYFQWSRGGREERMRRMRRKHQHDKAKMTFDSLFDFILHACRFSLIVLDFSLLPLVFLRKIFIDFLRFFFVYHLLTGPP